MSNTNNPKRDFKYVSIFVPGDEKLSRAQFKYDAHDNLLRALKVLLASSLHDDGSVKLPGAVALEQAKAVVASTLPH